MKPVSIGLALSVLAVFAPGWDARADAFDGAWLGGGPHGQNCGPIAFTMSVQGDTINGQLSSPQTRDALSGTVKPDGSFEAKTPDADVDGRFEGGRLSGKAHMPCGTLDIAGQKLQ
jgi:hypothetical protein